MKKISIIIIVLFSVLSIGCKKTHCPAFPADLNYFPYTKGQVLKFINSQQETHSFIINGAGNSGSWSFEWNCKCECDVSSTFEMLSNPDSVGENYFPSILGFINIYGEEGDPISEIGMNFVFSSYIYNSEGLSKTLEIVKPVPLTEVSKYIDDIIAIENENNKIITKIVIVKGKGLVSYTTADGEEWKLVE